MGFLTRSRDPADERQVRVRLTAEGAGLRTKGVSRSGERFQATGLSAAALRSLKGEIARVRDSLLKASSARDR